MSEDERFEIFDRLTQNASEMIQAAENGESKAWGELDAMTDAMMEAIWEFQGHEPMTLPDDLGEIEGSPAW